MTAAEDIPTDVEGLDLHIADFLGPADLDIEEDLEGYDVLDEALQRARDTELDMVRQLPCPRYSGQPGHGTRSANLVNGICHSPQIQRMGTLMRETSAQIGGNTGVSSLYKRPT
jgi:hypothetical protein